MRTRSICWVHLAVGIAALVAVSQVSSASDTTASEQFFGWPEPSWSFGWSASRDSISAPTVIGEGRLFPESLRYAVLSNVPPTRENACTDEAWWDLVLFESTGAVRAIESFSPPGWLCVSDVAEVVAWHPVVYTSLMVVQEKSDVRAFDFAGRDLWTRRATPGFASVSRLGDLAHVAAVRVMDGPHGPVGPCYVATEQGAACEFTGYGTNMPPVWRPDGETFYFESMTGLLSGDALCCFSRDCSEMWTRAGIGNIQSIAAGEGTVVCVTVVNPSHEELMKQIEGGNQVGGTRLLWVYDDSGRLLWKKEHSAVVGPTRCAASADGSTIVAFCNDDAHMDQRRVYVRVYKSKSGDLISETRFPNWEGDAGRFRVADAALTQDGRLLAMSASRTSDDTAGVAGVMGPDGTVYALTDDLAVPSVRWLPDDLLVAESSGVVRVFDFSHLRTGDLSSERDNCEPSN